MEKRQNHLVCNEIQRVVLHKRRLVTRASASCSFAWHSMAYEIDLFVLALLQGVSPTKRSRQTLEQAKADTELTWGVHVPSLAHNCPDVVQAVNLMAVLKLKSARHQWIRWRPLSKNWSLKNAKSMAVDHPVMSNGGIVFLCRPRVVMTLDGNLKQSRHRRSQPNRATACLEKSPYDVPVVAGLRLAQACAAAAI